MIYYKSLAEDGLGVFSGFGWSLPRGSRPGRWHEAVDEVVECKSGYHACTKSQLIHWLDMRVFEIESKSPWRRGEGKSVTRGPVRLVRELNWTDRSARLFLADCAERELSIYGRNYPVDDRSHKAIEAARGFARGEISEAELGLAEEEAWTASKYSPHLSREIEDAALVAAKDSDRRKGWRIARLGASDASRRWQTRRLFDYLEGRA